MAGGAPRSASLKPVPSLMRWPLGIWSALFAPNPATVQATADQAAPTADPLVRGAYLVDGLGHCGTCHTPRATLTMQEKGLTGSDPLFLAGGAVLDGWQAKNLRGDDADGLGRWSAPDIAALLKTGRNPHTGAAMEIAATRVPAFKPAGALKAAVRAG